MTRDRSRRRSSATFVAGFALLQLGAGGGGLALAGRKRGGAWRGPPEPRASGSGGGAVSHRRSARASTTGASTSSTSAGVAAVAAGDRSRTWRWPGTRAVDALAIYLAARLAPRSPLLARLVTDGTAMRAIFGSPSQLVPIAGLVLGILAVRDTGGEAVPPGATLTIAIAVISVIDAGAGMVAVATFLVGVLAHGGLEHRTTTCASLLGLTALWCVVPVVAGCRASAAARRRARCRSRPGTEPRTSSSEGWSARGRFSRSCGALPASPARSCRSPTTRTRRPTGCSAALAAAAVPGDRRGPSLPAARDRGASGGAAPIRPRYSASLATAWRTAIFLFLASVVVGTSWQLWVGTALFVIPQILSIYEDRLPNSPSLYRVLPKGLVELVLMLLVGTAVGALLLSSHEREGRPTSSRRRSCSCSCPASCCRSSRCSAATATNRGSGGASALAGVGLVVLGVLLALGLVF